MKKSNETKCKTAIENVDFTFSVSGTEHRNLSYAETEKLMKLSKTKWMLLREPNSPHPFSGKVLRFNDAF